MNTDARIAIVGGGPAGLIAALAVARSGAATTLIAPETGSDRRTTALLGVSVDVLRQIGVWSALVPLAAPLRKLRLVDGTRRIVRSPEVLFDSAELDLEAFGFNIENEALLAELRRAVSSVNNIRVIARAAKALKIGDDNVEIELDNGEVERCQLVVAADGKHSICRNAAGISMRKRPLPQSGVALSFEHTRPHQDISTEFHTESGPFTLVPLTGMRSSLVWVCTPDEAAQVAAMPDGVLARAIEENSHSVLGEIKNIGPRGIFSLSVELAEKFAQHRIALVGEAGHVLPPIGAQGLNLGIRDGAAIASEVESAIKIGDDLGSIGLLDRYDAQRRGDIRARALAVEALGRSLLTGFLPVHLARGLGLEAASRLPFLRRFLMKSGLGDPLPRH